MTLTDERPPAVGSGTGESPGSVPEEPGDLEPTVSYRDVRRSDALDDAILKGAQKLSEVHRRITSCRITLARTRGKRHSGDLYSARIDITVPGGEIVVNRAPPEREENEDLLLAVSHAFAAARRQLREYSRRQAGEVKTHVGQLQGRVVKLVLDQGYGFIRAEDDREFYFHEHSVLDGGFTVLEVGSAVRFVEGRGEEGPSATTVMPVGSLHLLD